MANIAFLRSNIVVCIAPSLVDAPAGLQYDATTDATGASLGYTWDGAQFTAPPLPVETQNENTLDAKVDAAMERLAQIIAVDPAAFAALTTAQKFTQLFNAVQDLAKYERAIIRLLRRDFSGTD